MSDSCDVVTAEELEDAGFTVRWACRLPVAQYTDDEGEPYWLRADLAPWLVEGGGD
jgi:hypothetical protein